MKKLLVILITTSFFCSSQASVLYGGSPAPWENASATLSEALDIGGEKNRGIVTVSEDLKQMAQQLLFFAAIALLYAFVDKDKEEDSKKDDNKKDDDKKTRFFWKQKKRDRKSTESFTGFPAFGIKIPLT